MNDNFSIGESNEEKFGHLKKQYNQKKHLHRLNFELECLKLDIKADLIHIEFKKKAKNLLSEEITELSQLIGEKK